MPRTAKELVKPERNDEYWKDIARAANAMTLLDKGHWIYLTHYASGATVWADPKSGRTELMSRKSALTTIKTLK